MPSKHTNKACCVRRFYGSNRANGPCLMSSVNIQKTFCGQLLQSVPYYPLAISVQLNAHGSIYFLCRFNSAPLHSLQIRSVSGCLVKSFRQIPKAQTAKAVCQIPRVVSWTIIWAL